MESGYRWLRGSLDDRRSEKYKGGNFTQVDDGIVRDERLWNFLFVDGQEAGLREVLNTPLPILPEQARMNARNFGIISDNDVVR